MENEYMKRGYLLPEGCKDVVAAQNPGAPWVPLLRPSLTAKSAEASKPPIDRRVLIPPGTSVGKLAELLHQKPFCIVGDLMKLGVFATVNHLLDFEIISVVAQKYGFEAIKAD